jgi:alanyl-tRNA synthetase
MEETSPLMVELEEKLSPTQFLGYSSLEAESTVEAIIKDQQLIQEAVEGETVELILDRTPFYAEGGGQVGDQGLLIANEGRMDVEETTKMGGKFFMHKGVVTTGRIRKGEKVSSAVNGLTRQAAARNHSATHLLHAALRDILGPQVKQYGSLVAPNRLRFDFAHFKPMSPQEIEEIELVVNEKVRDNSIVQTDVMGIQEAMGAGALAFFGDKYGEKVRVVEMGPFSKELCGGTHCRSTGEIGLFKIVSEGGVAAGVRRIEALTGVGALEHGRQVESDLREVADLLKTTPGEVISKARKLVSSLKEKERELEQLKVKLADSSAGEAKADVRTIKGVLVHVQRIDGLTMQELRSISDNIRNKVPRGVIALGSAFEGKVSLLVVVTKDLIGQVKAGDLVKTMAQEVGGSGGGRPEMAQAGGKFPEHLESALGKVFEMVEVRLS